MKLPSVSASPSCPSILRWILALLVFLPVAWAQTVATPIFLPVSGTSLTKFSVVVTCPTAGAVIRYTVTGAEPTLFDPIVVTGQTVQVAQNMTLKAKAFSGAVTSTTATTTFDLTGDVTAGSQNLLALLTNGQVYGWGYQSSGRIADGVTTTTNKLIPGPTQFSATAAVANAASIAAGARHGLHCDTTGAVWGQGSNFFGEAGNSSTATAVLFATQVVKSATLTDYLTGCTKVAAGLEFSAALEATGFVSTWGNQANGLLANGSLAAGSRKFAGRVKTTATTDLTGIRDIALGKDFALAREACSLESATALGRVWVWGNNSVGNLALGTTTSQPFATKAKLTATTDLTDLTDAWDVDAGDTHAAVVRWKTGDPTLQGSVWTFGNRANGRLGDNSTTTGTALFPVQVQKLVGTVYSPLTGIIQISCGPTHTLALDNTGSVWAWGGNATGALGDNSVIDKKFAVRVRNPTNTADLTGIARISAGGINGYPGFSAAVAKDGTLYAWGSNANGILANGTTSTTVFATLPTVISQLKTLPGFPTITLAAAVTTATAPGAATLTATVADPQGPATLVKTEFFLNGTLHTTKTAAPWTASLAALAAASYHSYAKVTDADGNITTSLPATFAITAPAIPDTDADGLPDAWEITHFTNLTQTATADFDSDGRSNLAEFTASTSPTDYYNGLVPTVAVASGNNQTLAAAAAAVTPLPITYSVKNTLGVALVNAPITVTITAPVTNKGGLDPTTTGTFAVQTLSVRTGATGQFATYYKSAATTTGPVKITLTLRKTAVVATTVATVLIATSDSDADGLLDSWEILKFTNLAQTATGDPDQDELTNLTEFQNNTHPNLLDTDADTQSDWQELAQSTNPNDSTSLIQPLAVSAHQGTTNLQLPQTLPNPTPANSYAISLTGNIPAAAPYELKSSNVAGGPAYEWQDISTTGEKLTAFKTNEDAVVQRPIGFSFPFYGTAYTQLFITGQGYATFVNPGSGFPHDFRAPLPNPAGTLALIAPYENYLEPNVLGDIYFQSFTTYAVVQWEQVKIYGFDVRPTFQAVIYPDGSIRFNYKSIPLTATGSYLNGYLSGIQNALGTSGLAASWYTSSQQGMALHSLAPLSLRFAALTSAATPWVTTTATTTSGNPLTWQLSFQPATLAPGLSTAVLQFRKSPTTPFLYTRPIRLTVLPLGTAGNDTLVGTAADDTLSGLAGNDTLTGGPGNDTLRGDGGKDTYLHNLGDGNDTLSDNNGIFEANDAIADYSDLYFGPGITPAMIKSTYLPDYASTGAAMKFEILSATSPGSITITDWNVKAGTTLVYTSARWRFHFQDTTVWNGKIFWTDPINTYPFQGFTGGITNETVVGSSEKESLRGLSGNDFLQGGGGWDTYFYEWGDGNDIIRDLPASSDIVLSELNLYGGVLAEQLTFDFVAPDHLRINIANTSNPAKNGSVVIEGWYQKQPILLKSLWRINVVNATGTVVDIAEFLKRTSTTGPDTIDLSEINTTNGASFDGGPGDDRIIGSLWNDIILGSLGNDELIGMGGMDTLNGGVGDDLLDGREGDDMLIGETGNDNLKGSDGADMLIGGADNDLLEGGTGDDTIIGGPGDDDLRGGSGNDVYHWNLGDGRDMIFDAVSNYDSTDNNRLIFGAGINPSQIELVSAFGTGLKFNVRDSNSVIVGSVVINEWYKLMTGATTHNSNWQISFVSNTTVWFGSVLSTPNVETFVGTSASDNIQGGAGGDKLQGLEGQDTLSGGANDDLLEGGTGDDTLIGGSGNDQLQGGSGSDIYQWSLGDGNDTITDMTSEVTTTVINQLVFGAEITPSQIELVPVVNLGLKFNVRDSSGLIIGSVTIGDWFRSVAASTKHSSTWRIIFTGNQTILDGRVLTTTGDDTLTGTSFIDNLQGGSGNDIIQGLGGADILSGGIGDDLLEGGLGDDMLNGGPGNDDLRGGTGSDVYHWNLGDGDDTITGSKSGGTLNKLSLGIGILPSDVVAEIVSPFTYEIRFIIFQNGLRVGSIRIKSWYVSFLGQPHGASWRIGFNNTSEWNGSALVNIGPLPITGLTDSDNDGILDIYEISNNLDPGDVADATNDTDQDGYTNLEEFQAETNIYDFNDKPWRIIYSRPVDNETNVSVQKVLVIGLDRPIPNNITLLSNFLNLAINTSPVQGTVKVLSDRKTIAFISSLPLTPNSKYRLNIKRSMIGLQIIPHQTVFITGGLEVENTKPFLMTTNPIDGDINVSKEIIPTSYWSEPLDEILLNSNTAKVFESGGVAIPCTINYDAFWHRLQIIPNANLEPNKKYSVIWDSPVKNLRGQNFDNVQNWSFTTIGITLPAPTQGPFITATVPIHLARNIATDVQITVDWNEQMEQQSLNTSTCKLKKSWNNEDIAIRMSYSSGLKKLLINPLLPLAENTGYRLTFTQDAKNVSGLTYSHHDKWETYFRTGIEAPGGGFPLDPDPGFLNPGPGGPGLGFTPSNP